MQQALDAVYMARKHDSSAKVLQTRCQSASILALVREHHFEALNRTFHPYSVDAI